MSLARRFKYAWLVLRGKAGVIYGCTVSDSSGAGIRVAQGDVYLGDNRIEP